MCIQNEIISHDRSNPDILAITMVNNGHDGHQSQSWIQYPIVRGLILLEHILFRYINDGYDEYLYEDNGKSIQNMLLKDFLKRHNTARELKCESYWSVNHTFVSLKNMYWSVKDTEVWKKILKCESYFCIFKKDLPGHT